jgi:hypothetical protein
MVRRGRWAIENPMRMCSLYVATLAAEGPHARNKVREWLNSSNERLHASEWTLLGRLSDLDESFPEDSPVHRECSAVSVRTSIAV